MARHTSPPPEDFEEHIVDIDVRDEMRASYLEYAYSVIYARALPDARDGLKPVQRRILYAMHDMGIRPDRGHVKSARVVGEVMGRLHPHGDGAIYDALVRLVQPWSMRLPLIDGHGNFGSPDDPPAAMRYSECRMADAAAAMTAGIDEDTVDFRPNYDSREFEPVVLPAAFPNLLVNGASGIAVGMATNLAPHNLIEVVQALKHLIAFPRASLDDLLRLIPGPDLPTGGRIIGLDGIREAYQTGRGSFRMRATARVDSISARRKAIVVSELPYGIGVLRVVERIKTLVETKKLQGIASVKDLSDLTDPLRLVIEVKNGYHPEALLEELYRQTPMEESFAVNAVALVDGQPRTLGLKQMLEVYLAHRYDVVRRRSLQRKTKASDRLHVVEGLLIAILDIDEVIQLIRASDTADEARNRLMTVFDLTQVQATYILDMPLRRLTRLSRIELETERDQLIETIGQLTAIIDDASVRRQVVSDELSEIAAAHGTPRRTILLQSAGQAISASMPLEVADEPCRVLLSASGLIARTTNDDPLGAGGPRSAHDAITSVARTTARGTIGVVTTRGRLVKLSVVDLPAVPPTANAPNLQGGGVISDFVALDADEHPVFLSSLDDSGLGLALGTANGIVKRVLPEVLPNRDAWDVIRLDDGDAIVGGCELADADDELVFVSTDAQLLRFPASAVRPQGRAGGGIAGIRLAARTRVVWFGAVDLAADNAVATVAGSSSALPGIGVGSVKLTDFREYPAKGRGTGGVRCHRFLKGEDALLAAYVGARPIKASGSDGMPVDLPAQDGRRDGSGTQARQPIAALTGSFGE